MPAESLIALGALLAVGSTLVFAARRRAAAPGRPGLFPREQEEHAGQQLERLVADLHDFSREHMARLDTKIRMLQQLLADADSRIRELRAHVECAPASAGSTTAADKASAGRPAAPRPANPLHDRVYALADGGRPLDEICRETGLEKGEVELIMGLRNVGAGH